MTISDIQTEIRDILTTKNNSVFLETHISKIEDDEKPTKFFYNRLKVKKEKHSIKTLNITENGQSTTTNDPDKIMTHTYNFYKDLFTRSETDDDETKKLFSCINKRLSPESVAKLEAPMTKKELYNALKQMPSNKTPGIDGIPAEFYLLFWDSIGDDFFEAVIDGFSRKKLSPSQRTAILKLLYKGDGLNKADLDDWRPISLLCVDYKIITKAYANRLKLVIGEIIHPDQTCGIPGRTIFSNLRLFRDVIHYTTERNLDGYLISIDQRKAFDFVDHIFLQKVLEKFGFGPTFRQVIATLYKDTTSHILLNGTLSLPMQISRGVRQGCPLSALLYVLIAETLAENIRSDKGILGIPVPGCPQTKISQYADDATLLIRKIRSIIQALVVINRFERASGSRLNRDKTKAFLLGGILGTANNNIPTEAERQQLGIQWIIPEIPDPNIPSTWRDKHVKLLGTKFLHDHNESARISFGDIADKFSDRIVPLRVRHLSLRGKIIAGNTLLSSKLWHTASVFPLPSYIEQRLRTSLFDFIWKSQVNPIEQEILYRPFAHAGLQLLEIATQSTALMSKQINDVINPQDFSPSTCIARFYLNRSLRSNMPLPIRTFLSRIEPWSIERPPFYFTDMIDCAKDHKILWDKPDKPPTVKQIYNSLRTPKINDIRINSQNGMNKWILHAPMPLHDNDRQTYWKNFWSASLAGYSPNFIQVSVWKLRHFIHWVSDRVNEKNRDPTQHRLDLLDPPMIPLCSTCHRPLTNMLHVFFHCDELVPVWKRYSPTLHSIINNGRQYSSVDLGLMYFTGLRRLNFKIRLAITIITYIIYTIWNLRCQNRFDKRSYRSHDFIRQINFSIRRFLYSKFVTAKRNDDLDTFKRTFAFDNLVCSVQNDKFIYKL